MATAKQIIESALRTIGVLASGEEGQPAELQDALSALNGMIDSWSNDSLLIPSYKERVFDLDDQKVAYTYGDGGDFDAPRPMAVEYAQILDNANFRYPCEIYGVRTWAQNVRPVTIRPSGIYYEASYPLSVIHFPTFPFSTDKLILQVIEPLANISSITNSFSLPKGYDRALKLNLAVEIAAEYNGKLSNITIGQAEDAKRQLKVMNAKVEALTFDFNTSNNLVYNIVQGPVK